MRSAFALNMKMFVAGEWVDAQGKETFDVKNPATGEIVGSVPKGSREDAKRAIDVARDAFKKWSEVPALERSRVLLKIAEVIRANLDELATSLVKEQGKPMGEAKSEINSFANTCEYYAGLIGRERGAQTPFSTGEGFFIVTKRPIGVVGAILPWNFPVSLMGWKVAPGLAAGNTFVVKPASTTPITDLKVVGLLVKAGLPPGAVNVVTGPGGVVGEELLDNPRVSKIAFTGETATGRRIMEGSAKYIKRLTLELGGSDPMIVCDDANLELARKGGGNCRGCRESGSQDLGEGWYSEGASTRQWEFLHPDPVGERRLRRQDGERGVLRARTPYFRGKGPGGSAGKGQ